ncbi:hypothetical protein PghCCS26_37140 [Paenibacillus glycanilyticus]|uniref:Uncharacterized protein n=1 Tax=Paenibacillus glycanilyticus TaxID=126569 RepID=A0ABQ6NPU0_9BACL|nr:hypothetical protein PghCCS26_37140 [Paenibacillus glycanilyticus]
MNGSDDCRWNRQLIKLQAEQLMEPFKLPDDQKEEAESDWQPYRASGLFS